MCSTNRIIIYLFSNYNWIALGSANVGNLVGLGRQDNFNVLFIMAHKFIKEEDKAIRISSLIAIVGIINIPIIKYSVEWWNTLHQSQSIKLLDGTSTIHTSMLVPLMLMLLVLLLYCALIFLMKYKTEIIRIKKKNIKRL